MFANRTLDVSLKQEMFDNRTLDVSLKQEMFNNRERICRLCHVELEDQQHCLLRCKCIKDLRVKLLQKVLNASEFSSSSDEKKCEFLLKPTTNIYLTCRLIHVCTLSVTILK